MIDLLRMRTAPETRTKAGLWFNRGAAFVILAAPAAGTVYAFARLPLTGISWTDLGLLLSFFLATGLGVTVGFHRLLTHSAFHANPVVKFVLLIFGTWSIQGAAINWAAIHSKHHVYSDGEGDPHSPVKNFWHGHMGWLFSPFRADPLQFAKTQMNDPLALFVSRTAFWWSVLGLVVPGLIGGWSGFLWGGLVRLFLAHHATWSVNSICHRFGSRPFQTSGTDRSTNNWLVSLLSLGEGWHNNHHAFPKSAFHGLSRGQIDFGGYLIQLLRALRLASDVYRPPPHVMALRRRPSSASRL